MASYRDKRNVFVLAICQALFNSGRGLTFLVAALAAINLLGEASALLTVPITMMLVGTASGTIPAAQLMRWLGRKTGFVISSLIGAIGGGICMYALSENSFTIFNIGIFLFGLYSGAAQQYRFAVADAAPDEFKAKAISLVIAAGVFGAFIGPEAAVRTKDLIGSTEFVGSFGALIGFTLASGFIVLGIDIPKLTTEEYADSGRPLHKILFLPVAVVAIVSATFGYAVMNFLMTATPISMQLGNEYIIHDVKVVIQWHVVGMFAPGFFTGSLIHRIGVLKTVSLGAFLQFAAVMVALAGTTLPHFWLSLFLLGIGWNFLYIGGSTFLTECYAPAEKAKVQGFFDFMIFASSASASFLAGALQHVYGWQVVNWVVLPLIAVAVILIVTMMVTRKRAAGISTPVA